MKKLTALFLVFLYIGTSSGVSLHLHYCMGEVVEWGTASTDKGHCEHCGMEKAKSTKNGCCKDELKKIQTDDSRKLTDSAFSTEALVAVVNEPFSYDLSIGSYVSTLKTAHQSNAPPRCKPVKAYILNCSYLI